MKKYNLSKTTEISIEFFSASETKLIAENLKNIKLEKETEIEICKLKTGEVVSIYLNKENEFIFFSKCECTVKQVFHASPIPNPDPNSIIYPYIPESLLFCVMNPNKCGLLPKTLKVLWNTISPNLKRPVIRLSYKIFLDPNTDSFPNKNVVNDLIQGVNEMNLFCTNNKLGFSFELWEDPLFIGGSKSSPSVSKWYNEHNTGVLDFEVKNKHEFAYRNNAVNLYVTGVNGWGGVVHTNSIIIAGDAVTLSAGNYGEKALIFHEIGHYFGLPHTFDNPPLQGDLKDIMFGTEDEIVKLNFGPTKTYSSLNSNQQQKVKDIMENIMSYHYTPNLYPNRRFTSAQIQRFHQFIVGQRFNTVKYI